MTSSEHPPISGHEIQTETHDQNTALSLVGVLLHVNEFS